MDKKQSILALSEDDESQELEFELQYQLSLSFEQRLNMMREKSEEMLRQMVGLGYRKPFEIIKRA